MLGEIMDASITNPFNKLLGKAILPILYLQNCQYSSLFKLSRHRKGILIKIQIQVFIRNIHNYFEGVLCSPYIRFWRKLNRSSTYLTFPSTLVLIRGNRFIIIIITTQKMNNWIVNRVRIRYSTNSYNPTIQFSE